MAKSPQLRRGGGASQWFDRGPAAHPREHPDPAEGVASSPVSGWRRHADRASISPRSSADRQAARRTRDRRRFDGAEARSNPRRRRRRSRRQQRQLQGRRQEARRTHRTASTSCSTASAAMRPMRRSARSAGAALCRSGRTRCRPRRLRPRRLRVRGRRMTATTGAANRRQGRFGLALPMSSWSNHSTFGADRLDVDRDASIKLVQPMRSHPAACFP